MLKSAKRTEKIEGGPIKDLFANKPPNSINFGAGDPDFAPPYYVIEAMNKANEESENHRYSPANGMTELREAIAQEYERYGLDLSEEIEDNVIVTQGGTDAIYTVFEAFTNPFDRILIPDPGWLTYFGMANKLGLITVSVETDVEDGFTIRADDIIEAIEKHDPRLVVLNSPTNPTGVVQDWRELKKIVEYNEERNEEVEDKTGILFDPVYELYAYDREHKSILEFGAAEFERGHIIDIGSFSKTYCMAGDRVGWAFAQKELIKKIGKCHQYTTGTTVSKFIQFGALEALQNEESEKYKRRLKETFRERRDVAVKGLKELGILPYSPSGSIYVFPEVPEGLGMNSEECSKYLKEKYGVLTVRGSAFGVHGEGYMRLGLCSDTSNIEEGISRMGKAFSSI